MKLVRLHNYAETNDRPIADVSVSFHIVVTEFNLCNNAQISYTVSNHATIDIHKLKLNVRINHAH